MTDSFDLSPAALEALADEVTRLRAECFALAAGACGGHYGDDHGHSRCSLVDAQRTRAEAAEAQSARLREALRACVQAHETGRYEPAHAAYNAARAALEKDYD